MTTRFMSCFIAVLFTLSGTFAFADPPPMSLAGMIKALANEVQSHLKDDAVLMGEKLAIGEFVGEGPTAFSSNYGSEMKRMFRDLLKSDISDGSRFTLSGSYHYIPAELPENKGLQVVSIVIKINKNGKEMLSIDREVNVTDDIIRVLGLTGSAPHGKDHKPESLEENNRAAQQAAETPQFDVQDGTRVAAKDQPQWSVGILKKSTFNGSATPVPPQNVNGLAFVPISIREYYEIEIVNHDRADTVATVTVDGLDVANTFSEDKDEKGERIHWPGYLIPAGHTGVIRGWLHTVKPGAEDSVFSFVVNEQGQGAVTKMKTRGSIGVITVQFREAVPPGGPLSGRSTGSLGETGQGEGLKEDFSVKPVTIGSNVLSTVSIRYNRPE